MKVAILGSNSFTGAHLADALLSKTGHHVIGISRSPEYSSIFLPYAYRKPYPGRFSFHQLDLNNNLRETLELLDREKPSCIFNFAAQGEVRTSWKHPHHWFQTNCMAFVRLLTELSERDYIKRYIHASTPEVYGACKGNVRENFCYRPSSPYAASKAAADLVLDMLSRVRRFPAVLTRAANVYGIHQQLYRIIPRAILCARLGRKLSLHGGGKSRRAFIHIRDVSDAYIRIMEKENPEFIYHLSPSEEPMSIRSIVELVAEMTGKSFNKFVETAPAPEGQDDVYELDSGLAAESLGWKPRVGFREGVAEMIGWIDGNIEEIKKHSFDYIHKE